MLNTVQATLTGHRLIASGDHVVAAVSGGADSVGLVHALAALRDRLGFSLSLAHVHHGLRGGDADADEAFVRVLAETLGLELDVERVQVAALAERDGLSLEMAAREARLRVFADVVAARSASAVATGHTRDDHIETVLLRLVRGSGAAGLAGIRAAGVLRGLPVIHPLLDCSRADVEAYLRGLGQTWREDRTNQDDRFLRNRVRHELLPMLRERFNPAVGDALLRASALLDQDEAFLEGLAAEALARCRRPDGLDAESVRAEPPALAGRILSRWLMEEGRGGNRLELALVKRLLELVATTAGSASVPLPGGEVVVREYDRLRVRDAGAEFAPTFHYELPVPGRTQLEACGLEATAGVEPVTDPHRPGRWGVWPADACLNRAAVGAGPVVIRSRRPGDRMRPLGLGGTTKLQDLFVDAKIPRRLRNQVPICLCRGEIVWVPGFQVADGWEVGADDSECVHIAIHLMGC